MNVEKFKMGKNPTIIELFKRKLGTTSRNENEQPSSTPNDSDETTSAPLESRPAKVLRLENAANDSNFVERDPGKRKQIWEYPYEKQNEIRRAYIIQGPYQPVLDPKEYKKSGPESHARRFNVSWYDKFRSWLEYSQEKDAAFCFPCFLFNKPDGHRTFTIDGFRNWKNALGKRGAFLVHVGIEPNSPHQNAVKALEDFLNQERHSPNIYAKQTAQEIADNRLRLKCSIKALRWLAMQGLPMRGRDESEESINQGHFRELRKHQASFNKELKKLLKSAPGNASYTSPDIQKEILHILAEKIKRAIKEEIGEAPFCIIVDEAGDVSRKQQMALILRFVDNLGLVKERFFTIIHVPNTSAGTLKNKIFLVLSNYCFNIRNLEPRASGQFFNLDDICNLVTKFYPEDFTDVEKEELRVELRHYEIDLSGHQVLRNLSTISELSQWLVDSGKINTYPLIFRLVKLLLTLPVSTASAERAFSAMNIIKTIPRNKMEADMLENCMLIRIERGIAKTIKTSSIIDTFRDSKERRVLF